MRAESKALLTLKRLAIAWPLLSLPFIPAIGKGIAGVVLMVSLHYGALQ